MLKRIKLMMMMALGAVIFVQAQDADQVLAKVEKIEGKQVYVLNEPLRQYEIVGEVKTGIKIVSLLTRGIISEDISAKSAQFTRKAIRKFEKQGIEFDAVLYQKGRKAQVIKFINSDDQDLDGLAGVKKINGLIPFVMAEPNFDYEVTNNVKNLVSLRSFLTYGYWNNSIEQDTKGFAKKVNRKNDEAVYLSYQDGKRISVITAIE